MTNHHSPDPIDVFCGAKMRERRRDLKISQKGLAQPLGITFQQVQKYERGSNRISASMLVRASIILQVSPAWFFEGIPDAAIFDPANAGPDLEHQLWLKGDVGAAWVAAGRALPAHAIEPILNVARVVSAGAAAA